jgi:hypothetical protein
MASWPGGLSYDTTPHSYPERCHLVSFTCLDTGFLDYTTATLGLRFFCTMGLTMSQPFSVFDLFSAPYLHESAILFAIYNLPPL